MKRLAYLFLAIVMTVTMLSGCAGREANPAAEPQTSTRNDTAQTADKEKVVVACWGRLLDLPAVSSP